MKALIERVTQHPRSTIGGVVLSAIGLYVLNSWDCKLPQGVTGWMAWGMVAGPAVLGLLSKDK